jgi:hypothetical protein
MMHVLTMNMEVRNIMLSRGYVYKSNSLKERYIDDIIGYEEYMASLETIKNEELKNAWLYGSERLQEIYSFEEQQFKDARRAKKKKETEKLEEERRQREYKERQEKIKAEEDRIKSLTPEQKLYEEREIYYKKRSATNY